MSGDGRPGSSGEHELQEQFGHTKRANAFYDNQVLDYLTAEMRDSPKQSARLRLPESRQFATAR